MRTDYKVAGLCAVALMGFGMLSLAQSDNSEYAIIANKDVQGNSISIAALKGIYLREVRTWSNGTAIMPVDLTSESSFYQSLFGKSYSQMQAYWLNMRVKYNLSFPISKKDPESAKKVIAENKGAIGFIKSEDVDDRVKVLKIEK
jgi:hypothetical protein